MLKKINWNSFWIGSVFGLLLPFLSLVGYWLYSFRYMKFYPQFIHFLMNGRVLSAVLSLCLIPNLGMFFLFINNEKYKTTRGIILTMLLYGFVILYLKIYVEHSWDN